MLILLTENLEKMEKKKKVKNWKKGNFFFLHLDDMKLRTERKIVKIFFFLYLEITEK